MSPLDVHGKVLILDDCYSVVITDHPASINVMTLQSFIYQTDQNGTKFNENGTPLGRYANKSDYENGITTPTLAFRTPLAHYDTHKEAPFALNALKNTSMLIRLLCIGTMAMWTKVVNFMGYIFM